MEVILETIRLLTRLIEATTAFLKFKYVGDKNRNHPNARIYRPKASAGLNKRAQVFPAP